MVSSRESNLTRIERMQIMLSPEELAAVDNFRFKHRMPSRAAAARHLLGKGIAVADREVTPQGTKSVDFGVLNTKGSDGDGRAA
jgi:hypothetical protein